MDSSKILFRTRAKNDERIARMDEIARKVTISVLEAREKLAETFAEIAHMIAEAQNMQQKEFTRES